MKKTINIIKDIVFFASSIGAFVSGILFLVFSTANFYNAHKYYYLLIIYAICKIVAFLFYECEIKMYDEVIEKTDTETHIDKS